MPINETSLLLCYNKGCGLHFDPNTNTEESCLHHPGAPFFHDAYKGWSCCKKKCTDFTEFLNIKGCSRSSHNNIKPEEPQKVVEKSDRDEVIEYKAPVRAEPKRMERPPMNTPLVRIIPSVSNTLREQVVSLKPSSAQEEAASSNPAEIPLGTLCKRSGCNRIYQGPATDQTHCIYHPGVPIFHEGLKYWTCCTKRTTDFNTFLEQVGCHFGDHVWLKPNTGNAIKCRLDWHQTGQFVVVSVYAKKYDPDSSTIQLSPVRLKISLHFPEQDGTFVSDLELTGIVEVNRSSVQMLQTKVEIKLHKAEAVNWTNLYIPPPDIEPKKQEDPKVPVPFPKDMHRMDVDLSGI